jgi:hypothetical protein
MDLFSSKPRLRLLLPFLSAPAVGPAEWVPFCGSTLSQATTKNGTKYLPFAGPARREPAPVKPLSSAKAWIACLLSLPLCLMAQEGFPQKWAFQRTLTLNTTATGANVAATQTAFPLLVRLGAGQSDVFSGSRGRGRDLRFANASGTVLRHQIEAWDSAGAAAAIWVLADTVKGNARQTLTLFWGNPDAAETSQGPSVFGAANGFQAVWHFAETAGDSARDATGNGFSAAPKDAMGLGLPAATPGIIGAAKAYLGNANGTGGGYYLVPGSVGGKLDFPIGGSYTISAWASTDVVNRQFRAIVTGHDQQYALDITSGDMWEFNEYDITGGKWGWQDVLSPAAGHEGKWKQVVGVRDGAKEYLYLDGVLASDAIKSNAGGSGAHLSSAICIGKRGDNLSRFWAGKIDEVQMSGVARSADWIKLSYANQAAAQTLLSIGPASGTKVADRRASSAADKARGAHGPDPTASGRVLLHRAAADGSACCDADAAGRSQAPPLR